MNQLRHLLLATTLASLAYSGFVTAVSVGAELKVGESEFTLHQTVKSDNLWTIARRILPTAGNVTQNQLMAAILHRNPNAFEQGNMFYLRQGVVLIVPGLQEIRAEDAAKADALFDHHHKAWSEGHPALLEQNAAPEISVPKTAPEVDKGFKADSQASAMQSPSGREEPKVEAAPPHAAAILPDKLNQSKKPQERVEGLERAEGGVKPQAGSNHNGLIYGFGFAAIVAALYFFFRRRVSTASEEEPQQSAPAATRSSQEVQSAQEEVKRTPKTKESPEAVRAAKPDINLPEKPAKNVVVTQQVVVNESLGSAHEEISKASDEAAMKLNMAKAYMELNREDAARTLLEEVTVEGGVTNRNKAKKLLRR